MRLLDKPRLYPGIRELLRSPPGDRAVLTNKPAAFAREILRGLGVLDCFRALRGGDQPPRKPSPDGLLQLCAEMGRDRSEVLMVGDSAVDLATARAGGVPFCGVGWGLGTPEELRGGDHFCRTPEELSALLARL